MKKIAIITISILTSFFAFAQAAAPKKATAEKATIAITKVVAEKNVISSAAKNSTTTTLDTVIESLDSNLMASFQATRKFEILTRSDIDAVMKEQDFAQSGNVDTTNKNVAQLGKMKGAKYVVNVKVTALQDNVETGNFSTIGRKTERRILRFEGTAEIIDTTTASILEIVSFKETNDGFAEENLKLNNVGGSKTNELIGDLSRKACDFIANQVADIIFPAKVIGKTGKTVMFNRGSGTGITVGDIYEVYALGEAMIDPDTGENLGAEEASIGKIEVTQITPKFSKGKALEDNGIERGQTLRLLQKAPEKKLEKKVAEDNEF